MTNGTNVSLASGHSQRGAALLSALLLVALVVVLAAQIMNTSARWYRQVKLEGDRLQAQALADAAIDFGRAILTDDGRRSSSDDASEAWAQPLPPMNVEGGWLAGSIEDLQGKINLNAVLTDAGPMNRWMTSQGLTKEAVEFIPALLDALDTDSEPRFPGGAEDQYYLALPTSSRAINGPLALLDDVRAIRGGGAELLRSIRRDVTVWPSAGAVNVNLASAGVLHAVVPTLSVGAATALRRDLDATPVRNMSELPERLQRVGWNGGDLSALGVSSRYFLIRGEVRWGEASVRMRVAVERQGGNQPPRILWRMPEPLGSWNAGTQP